MEDYKLAEYIRQLEKDNRLYRFYKSKAWCDLKDEVLTENHNECQLCKAEGKIRKAETVHHINYVHDRPELALSKTFIDVDGVEKQNLMPLCFDCHNKIHKRFNYKENKKITQERW